MDEGCDETEVIVKAAASATGTASERETAIKEVDEQTAAQRAVPGTVGSNARTTKCYNESVTTKCYNEVFQRSVEPSQTADIINMPKIAQKIKSRSATATLTFAVGFRYRCTARFIYIYRHTYHTYTWCLHKNNTLDRPNLPDSKTKNEDQISQNQGLNPHPAVRNYIELR